MWDELQIAKVPDVNENVYKHEQNEPYIKAEHSQDSNEKHTVVVQQHHLLSSSDSTIKDDTRKVSWTEVTRIGETEVGKDNHLAEFKQSESTVRNINSDQRFLNKSSFLDSIGLRGLREQRMEVLETKMKGWIAPNDAGIIRVQISILYERKNVCCLLIFSYRSFKMKPIFEATF